MARGDAAAGDSASPPEAKVRRGPPPAFAERYLGMTAPGPAERRGTGQSRGRRGGRGLDHGDVCRREACGGRPLGARGGVRGEIAGGAAGPLFGARGLRGSPGGCQPRFRNHTLKGRAPPIPDTTAPEPRRCWRTRRGRVGRGMAAGAGGSRCGSPWGTGSSWQTGLGRGVPHFADGLRTERRFFNRR